jgi:serine/threonine protein kinase
MADEAPELSVNIPPRMACLFCGETIIVAGRKPFSNIECPHCHKTFALPVPFGKFVLLELLGRGGMGAVYKGFDPNLKRPVAIKVMQKQLGSNAEFVRQFEREAQMLAALNNPHIVQVYAAGSEQDQPYIVMELVDRGRFDQMIARKGDLEEKIVVRTALDVLQGLKAAAASGLTHGDLKPENILFDKEGHAKVVDFGLARFKGEAWQPGVIWGTPNFIAPEVVRGKQPNLQSDIYNLGCSLYYALTKRLPFEKETLEETVLARFKEKPKPLASVRPDLHPETVAAVERMMEVEPIRRYPNYDSLIVDMTAARNAIERKVPASSAKAKPAKSNAAWWIGSLLMSLLVVAIIAGLVSRKKETADRLPPPPAQMAAPAPAAPKGPVVVARDTAAKYNEWRDGVQGGRGFDPWVMRCGLHSGFFVGSSTDNPGPGDIDTAGKAWGIFAHSNDYAAAWRRISAGRLGVATQQLILRMDHGKVRPGGPSVGVGLQNASSNNLWEFFIAGGDKEYIIHDGADDGHSSRIPYTEDGIRIQFRLTSTAEYVAEIIVGSKTNRRTGKLIAEADKGIRVIHLWNFNAGDGHTYDAYFNDLSVISDPALGADTAL